MAMIKITIHKQTVVDQTKLSRFTKHHISVFSNMQELYTLVSVLLYFPIYCNNT